MSFVRGDFFFKFVFLLHKDKKGNFFSYHLHDTRRQRYMLQRPHAYNLNLGKRFINVPKANKLSYPVITYAKIKLEEIIVLSSWAESSLFK